MFFDTAGQQDEVDIRLDAIPVDVSAADLEPPNGHRFVALALTFINRGYAGQVQTFDLTQTLLLTTMNARPTQVVAAGTFAAATPRLPGVLRLGGGQSASGWVVFSIETGDRAFSLDFEPDDAHSFHWSVLPPGAPTGSAPATP